MILGILVGLQTHLKNEVNEVTESQTIVFFPNNYKLSSFHLVTNLIFEDVFILCYAESESISCSIISDSL